MSIQSGLSSLFGLLYKTGGPLILLLVLFNLVSILVGLLISVAYPVLLSSVLIAYTLGLRHAVDADHLAAIDNVTRRLVSEGKKPTAVGLFFSLGHSTIVFGMTAFVAMTASLVSDYYTNAAEVGELIGTLVSALFLYLIGCINLYCLYVLYKEWKKNKEIEKIESIKLEISDLTSSVQFDEAVDDILEKQEEKEKATMGFCVRCCPKLLNIVDASYKMYFVGFLFGLGFDTASEIALLSIAALAPGEGVPPIFVMILPIIFAAGMALIDTIDGIMMIWAYGWAFVEGDKKMFYNFFVTLTSLLIAFVIGTLELLGIIGEKFELDSPFWNAVAWVNFETVGILIIVLFFICFIVAVISYRIRYGSFTSSTSVESFTDESDMSLDEEESIE